MQFDQDTWNLAKLMVEQQGQNAMHGARKVTENIRLADDGMDGADLVNVVRAMDFLLSEDETGNLH